MFRIRHLAIAKYFSRSPKKTANITKFDYMLGHKHVLMYFLKNELRKKYVL